MHVCRQVAACWNGIVGRGYAGVGEQVQGLHRPMLHKACTHATRPYTCTRSPPLATLIPPPQLPISFLDVDVEANPILFTYTRPQVKFNLAVDDIWVRKGLVLEDEAVEAEFSLRARQMEVRAAGREGGKRMSQMWQLLGGQTDMARVVW